jgi:hypothetical protein
MKDSTIEIVCNAENYLARVIREETEKGLSTARTKEIECALEGLAHIYRIEHHHAHMNMHHAHGPHPQHDLSRVQK